MCSKNPTSETSPPPDQITFLQRNSARFLLLRIVLQLLCSPLTKSYKTEHRRTFQPIHDLEIPSFYTTRSRLGQVKRKKWVPVQQFACAQQEPGAEFCRGLHLHAWVEWCDSIWFPRNPASQPASNNQRGTKRIPHSPLKGGFQVRRRSLIIILRI